MSDISAAMQEPSSSTEPVAQDDRPITETTPPTTSVERDPQPRTRIEVTWVGIVVFAVLLVLLLIFILQNTESVRISYFGANGHLSLAVAMLFAAVAGVLLTALAGSLRIWQLRRHFRRQIRRHPSQPPEVFAP